jgi:uncharacterized protein YlxW (UPF0749 family)
MKAWTAVSGRSSGVGTCVRFARDAVTLLESISSDALDPAYSEAARRRSIDSRPDRGLTLRAAEIALPVVLVGLLLVTALGQTRRSVPDLAEERAALAARVEDKTLDADALQYEVERLSNEVAAERSAGLNVSNAGRRTARDLARLELAAGGVPVTGPGLRIVVDDGQVQEGEADADPARILDTDLQRLVNGLWAADAEAVAINGQRLTGTTAIRSAGSAVTVGFRPLGRPYTIEAIGDPGQIEARFVDGPGGRWFRTLQDNYGVIFRVAGVRSLRLPASSAVDVRYAEAEGAR